MVWLLLLAALALFALGWCSSHHWQEWFHRWRVGRYYATTHLRTHQLGRDHKQGTRTSTSPPFRVGRVVRCDYRDPASAPPARRGSLRIVSWNIEFGYKLAEVVAELRRLDADVVLLQEVDWCHAPDDVLRPFTHDAFHEIASALGLAGIWAPHYAYRSKGHRGAWGNAILTRFAIEHEHDRFLPLRHLFDYDRSALSTMIRLPHAGGRLCVCSVHLEVCCGISVRVRQFERVLQHLQSYELGDEDRVVIGGDLNTFGHGLLRLSPFHCNDAYRFRSLFYEEAQWWEERVLPALLKGRGTALARLADPFEKSAQHTLAGGPMGVFAGKLDWLFLDPAALRVLRSAVGTGTQSDHAWISVDVSIPLLL